MNPLLPLQYIAAVTNFYHSHFYNLHSPPLLSPQQKKQPTQKKLEKSLFCLKVFRETPMCRHVAASQFYWPTNIFANRFTRSCRLYHNVANHCIRKDTKLCETEICQIFFMFSFWEVARLEPEHPVRTRFSLESSPPRNQHGSGFLVIFPSFSGTKNLSERYQK